MDNRRKRGLAFQRWCKDWIMETYPDCAVHNQPMNHVCIGPGRWACQDNDILGCIDLLVISPTSPPLFIQATLDAGVGRKLDKLRSVPWDLNFVSVQLWIKRSPTRVSIKELVRVDQGELTLVDKGEIERRKYVRRD